MKHKILHLQSLVAVALCVIMAMAFTSCSDDDDEPASNSIVGTWRLARKESASTLWYYQFNFNSNGNFEFKMWSPDEPEDPSPGEYKGTYTISNQFITLNYYDDDKEIYRFSIEGNKLILYDFEDDGPNEFYKV